MGVGLGYGPGLGLGLEEGRLGLGFEEVPLAVVAGACDLLHEQGAPVRGEARLVGVSVLGPVLVLGLGLGLG